MAYLGPETKALWHLEYCCCSIIVINFKEQGCNHNRSEKKDHPSQSPGILIESYSKVMLLWCHRRILSVVFLFCQNSSINKCYHQR